MQGHIVLLIDDFNFADARRRQEVANFVRTYPSVRLIITTRTELFSDLGVSASLDEAIPLRPIFMEQFRRRELRELVERWSLNPSVDRETLLDRLVHELVHINVPLTAVNGTILLSIYETQPDFTPINRAVLIETFVEKLLHKHQLNNARRDRFDFRNKAHLLSHIAKIMTLKDEYRMQYEDIVAESRCYFRTVGLVDRAREQVDRFLGARILAEKEGWISFQYRAFLEYFIARQMEEEALPGRWRKRRDFGTGSSGIHVTFLS